MIFQQMQIILWEMPSSESVNSYKFNNNDKVGLTLQTDGSKELDFKTCLSHSV